MVFVLGFFAAGCLFGAIYKAQDKIDRAWWLGCTALNALAAGLMIHDGYRYAWKLGPNSPLSFLGIW